MRMDNTLINADKKVLKYDIWAMLEGNNSNCKHNLKW